MARTTTHQEHDTPTPTRGVPLTLNGTTYYVRFSFRTLRKIREDMGEDVLSQDLANDKLMKVLWYGLGGEHGALSVEAVEDEVDLEHLGDVITAIRQAMGGVPTDPPVPQPAAAVMANNAGEA